MLRLISYSLDLSKKSVATLLDNSDQKCEICQYLKKTVISCARTVQRCAGVVISCRLHFELNSRSPRCRSALVKKIGKTTYRV